jgi:predicted SAM-dependent methyltransferase
MPVCLNVGCHDIHIEGFINVDIDPAMKPELVADARTLSTVVEPNSVDFIYCGHLLEHFSVSDSILVAKEMLTVLRPYGTLCCVVPDFRKAAKMHIDQAQYAIIADGCHKRLYDEDSLRQSLLDAGFGTVVNTVTQQMGYCPFKEVEWQSACVAIKHTQAIFKFLPIIH